MHARVTLERPDGSTVVLGHGDLIGRLPTAALVLDDPCVSEAHAMVSLRGSGLHLLALRRPVRVDGRALPDVPLAAGMVLEFADDVIVGVVDVEVPDEVAALSGDGLPRVALPSVASLYVQSSTRLVPRFEPEADAHLWSLGEAWRLRTRNGAVRPVHVGASFDVAGRTFQLDTMALRHAAGHATVQVGAVHAPLRLVARFDSVHLVREGAPTVVLNGVLARLVSELAVLGCPVGWEALCAQLWPHETVDKAVLRHRLDMALLRLRKRLQTDRVRTDLVMAAGTGLIELVLQEGDVVVDET
ncbi:MAG: FHA domain-containing protein [Alphaproteobacteria bacterium]|nr:FHA domain-containing protein [Alphaproteobacteria bacterium]